MMAEMESVDERYEFDAPTHVVDFEELLDAELDEKWFECLLEGPGGPLFTPLRTDKRQMRADELVAVVIPEVGREVDSEMSVNVPGQSVTTSPPANIVTSWGNEAENADRPRTRTPNEHPAQPHRVSKRKEMTDVQAAPPSKKHKVVIDKKSRTGQLNSRLGSRKSVRLSSRTAHKVTDSTSAHSVPNTTEELELERIRNLQREVALHSKKNEASYEAALAGHTLSEKIILSTTVPKDFHFNTDARIKASTSNAAHKEVDFVHQLREPSSPAKARKGATVSKPFNLSVGAKRKEEEPGPSPVKVDHLKLTQPHSPRLMTRQRCRPPAVKSSTELEAEEVEKLQKFKIKALELNKKILVGVEQLKKPPVKEPTVPEGFELEIEERLQERQTTKKPQEGEDKAHNFKAKPLPKKVLEGVVGLPEKRVQYPTVPESPAFALKKRVRMDPKVEEVKPPSLVKASAVPHFGLPFQPRLPENHHVEVCPFSFDERERERRALKEKRLEEMRSEEVPHFKAQLLPDFDTVVLPEKKKLEPTKAEPFRLLVDQRGAVKKSRREQMIKEEQKQQEEAAAFKARPNTVTHKEPFRPKKENRAALEDTKSSTVVEAFELATERRAREWQEYERLLGEKEALRARMEAEQRREEEQKLKDEITKLRREQVHRAQPVRHYKPVAVKKSEVPLTIPESPNFSDRFRL